MTPAALIKTEPETKPKPEVKPEPEAKNKPPPLKKRRARGKWLIPTIIGGIVLAVLGVWGWQMTHPASSSTSGLITAAVTRGSLVETVTATGSISAQTGAQVKIGSQITGRIKELYADIGTQVKAKQLIAVLDLPDIQAQLDQAKANLAAAQIKKAQFQSGVGMLQTQLSSAIVQTEAGRKSGFAKVHSAQAADNQQRIQTATDIQRGLNGVDGASAALSTAHSSLAQVQAGSDLQVANAQQQVNQAQANALNSTLNLKRQQTLFNEGFVAGIVLQQAQATADVNTSLVVGAQQSLVLVQQKNTADLQAGQDTVAQAVQNVKTAQATLLAARAETYLNRAKQADVRDAQALAGQAEASLTIANGNTAQNGLKQQDISQAAQAVRAAAEQVAYAQAQVNKTFIRSPISGTVIQLAAQQGETLAAGLSSPTLIVVADLNRLEVDAYVDETDIGKVRIGQRVTSTVDAFPNKTFAGHVTKIASGSTIQQGVITYDVTIALDSAGHQLKPDMTAEITIQTGNRDNVLLVPSEAVKTGVSGQTVNILMTKNGKSFAQARKVVTGGTDGVNTEIASGVKEGDMLILAGTLKAAAPRKSTSLFSGGGRGGGGPPR